MWRGDLFSKPTCQPTQSPLPHQLVARFLRYPQPLLLLTVAPASFLASYSRVCVYGCEMCGEDGEIGRMYVHVVRAECRVSPPFPWFGAFWCFGSAFQNSPPMRRSIALCSISTDRGMMRARWCTSAAAVYSLLLLAVGQGGP